MSLEELISKIESILFVSSKPVSVKQLAKILNVEESLIETAATQLVEKHRNNGVVVLYTSSNLQMATNGLNTEVVNSFLNADLREKLTDATVEVLGIIAYRGPISRSEIEAIRGVNSQYSVRNLLIRGLIEKVPGLDSRSTAYQVTTDFLQQFGLTSTKDLPDFNTLTQQIKLPEVVENKDQAANPAPVEHTESNSEIQKELPPPETELELPAPNDLTEITGPTPQVIPPKISSMDKNQGEEF
jgi:segregation and condensation protein B